MLRNKSLTELRAIYQGYGGGKDIFHLTVDQLRQEIERKQQGMIPKEVIDIPRPEYDARLMDKPPAKKSDGDILRELLEPYIAKGMHLNITPEIWYISHGKKTDQGSMRMPPRHVLNCCERLMK